MAGLEAAAGVIGIVSTGVKFAKTLYTTINDIVYAHMEMSEVASKVRELSIVLEHLGESLEVNGGCCSDHMMNDIRLIIRSCTSTFEELDESIKYR